MSNLPSIFERNLVYKKIIKWLKNLFRFCRLTLMFDSMNLKFYSPKIHIFIFFMSNEYTFFILKSPSQAPGLWHRARAEPEPGPFPKNRAQALQKWTSPGRARAEPRARPITNVVLRYVLCAKKELHRVSNVHLLLPIRFVSPLRHHSSSTSW